MIEANSYITDKSLQELKASFQDVEEEYLKPFFSAESRRTSPSSAQIIDERSALQDAI